MFGFDPKQLAAAAELVERMGGEFLVELKRLNDNLEALRRDGVQLKPERAVPRMDTSGAPDFADVPPA